MILYSMELQISLIYWIKVMHCLGVYIYIYIYILFSTDIAASYPPMHLAILHGDAQGSQSLPIQFRSSHPTSTCSDSLLGSGSQSE